MNMFDMLINADALEEVKCQECFKVKEPLYWFDESVWCTDCMKSEDVEEYGPDKWETEKP